MSDTVYSVWTHNTSPEWLKKNSGVTSMILAANIDRYNANFAALRLKEFMPGADFFIRDDHGNTVPLVDQETAYYELVEKPRRLAAGIRP